MATYSAEQLQSYYERIHFNPHDYTASTLPFVTALLRHQLVHVPFGTLGLHYSVERKLSLEPQHLYTKIVVDRRGGYCLENNAFFAAILRSLGFTVYSVFCRITNATRGIFDGSWRPVSHMTNILILDGQRFLLDVGFGVDGPSTPLPLVSGSIVSGRIHQKLRLEHRKLEQHLDPDQKVWVYSQRRSESKWHEIYHFHEQEILPADFEILNHYNMTIGHFTQKVVAQRFFFGSGEHCGQLSSTLLLVQDRLERRDSEGTLESSEVLQSEPERIAVLAEYFGLVLNEAETSAIQGTATALPL